MAQQQVSLSWHTDWRTTAFTGVLLPVLIGLGLWQLQRADEKEQIERAWSARQQQAAQSLPPPLDPAELAHVRVELRGRFLAERQIFLDNSMRNGRYGLEVLTPLRIENSDELVLVNRGWVAGDPARRSMPQVATPQGVQQLLGSIYVSPGSPYTLGSAEPAGTWPRLLLALDMGGMETLLAEPVYPFSVRLEAGSPAALVIDWPLLNNSPEKHRAYAVQWFAMALALMCLYLARSSNLLAWMKWRVGGRHD